MLIGISKKCLILLIPMSIFMEDLYIKYRQKLGSVPTGFVRDLINQIDWQNRFIGIKGARGVGKTTLLLQYAKLKLANSEKSLYASLDDFYFKRHRLYDFAAQFVREGGQVLLLDEVHRYDEWSQELKNIYDDFPSLRIIFTGSSIIHLSRSKGDLSRRAILYNMVGLSFREFLQLQQGYQYPMLTMKELVLNHTDIALDINQNIKPLQFFQDYLRYGYHPYFLENVNAYASKLVETVNLLLETDFPSVYSITYPTIDKIKTFLIILAESVPFKPNIQKLSEQVELTRNALIEHLHQLEDAGLLQLLHRNAKGITRLQKPEKIFLGHTNLAFVLNEKTPEMGMLRETFFLSQLRPHYLVEYTEAGDFWIDNYFTIEVGGHKKGYAQIQSIPNSFIAADGIEIGIDRKIPLWLFGFLY